MFQSKRRREDQKRPSAKVVEGALSLIKRGQFPFRLECASSCCRLNAVRLHTGPEQRASGSAFSTLRPRRRSPKQPRRGGRRVENATRPCFETGDVLSAPSVVIFTVVVRPPRPLTGTLMIQRECTTNVSWAKARARRGDPCGRPLALWSSARLVVARRLVVALCGLQRLHSPGRDATRASPTVAGRSVALVATHHGFVVHPPNHTRLSVSACAPTMRRSRDGGARCAPCGRAGFADPHG